MKAFIWPVSHRTLKMCGNELHRDTEKVNAGLIIHKLYQFMGVSH